MCTENVSNFLWCTCSANIVVWSISKHCLLKSVNLFSAASQAALPSGERSKQSTTFTFSYASFTSFTAKRSSVSNELSPSGAGWPCCGGAEAGRSTRTITTWSCSCCFRNLKREGKGSRWRREVKEVKEVDDRKARGERWGKDESELWPKGGEERRGRKVF